jgi:hypothetical protein
MLTVSASSPAAAWTGTSKYRDLAKAAGELKTESAVIDGEIIMLNDAGLSDFGELRKVITSRQHDLYVVAFDLLHLNGHDFARHAPGGPKTGHVSDLRDHLRRLEAPVGRHCRQ